MKNSNDVEELKKRLLEAAGMYSDYSEYAHRLDELDEMYDETLELYDYPVWMELSHGSITEKAKEMLQVTGEVFREMEKNAREEVLLAVEAVCRLGPEEQQKVWGMVVEEGQYDRAALEDGLFDWEYEYCQDEAFEELIELVKEKLCSQ